MRFTIIILRHVSVVLGACVFCTSSYHGTCRESGFFSRFSFPSLSLPPPKKMRFRNGDYTRPTSGTRCIIVFASRVMTHNIIVSGSSSPVATVSISTNLRSEMLSFHERKLYRCPIMSK